MADRVLRAALLLFAVVAVPACHTTYYDEYRSSHPDFDPSLPRAGMSLQELLAGLHAPSRVETIEVVISHLAIFRTGPGVWEAIPFESIRSGDADIRADGDYVVLVGWTCHFTRGLKQGSRQRSGYYLLPHDQLTAYDHYGFHDGCGDDEEFVAARGALVATEREAFERLSGGHPTLSLTQAYRRGLGYVEAGRLLEARAMLVLGERSYRAAAEKLRADGHIDALADAERLRTSLMRALGVQDRPKPPKP